MRTARSLIAVCSLIAVLPVLIATCTADSAGPPPGPTQLAFQVGPTSATAGATIAPAVVVEARDAQGNVVTDFNGPVTVAFQTNPGGGTLSGTTTVAAVAGIATFGDLSINRKGSGYRFQATSGSLTAANSATFNITAGPAASLVFTQEPSTVGAGGPIAPTVTVAAQDALGNTVDGFTGNITVAISNNPAGGTLSGTTTAAAIAGEASFPTLSIDKVGAGYELSATAPGLTDATSFAFDVIPGPAAKLIITVQPSSATAAAAITPAVEVTVLDALGNTATSFTGNVTLALGTNPGGGTLAGVATVPASAGVATFSGLSIDKAGTGYTLSASAAGLTGATSDPFDIAVGTATQVVFTVEPVTTTAGAPITPAVAVAVKDAGGNTVTSFTGNVAIAIITNPAGGTLSGTTSVAAVAGVATFSTLSIDKSGSGYALSATAPGLIGETSASFDIASGPAARLAITGQPSNATATVPIAPAVRVIAQDALGNIATSFSGNVTVAIGTNPAGGTLSGGQTVAAVAGIVDFSTLSIDKAGTGYTLSVSAVGLTGATSILFDIAVGAATQLEFTSLPAVTTAGSIMAPPVQVAAQDAGGNTVTSFTGNVTVAIGTNPGAGTTAASATAAGSLSGTTTVAAVAGVATFSDLSIDVSGSGYTLVATTSSGLSAGTSASFQIAAGAPTQLAVTGQPTNAAAGAPITPAVHVTVRDAAGNTVTSFTGDVTIAIGTNPAGGTLSGTKIVAAVAGVATFSSLNIDRAGSGYTLSASAAGLTGATSAAFDIAVGAATQLVFTTQPPASTTAGAAMTPAVAVSAHDAGGNVVPGFTGLVTASIGTNSGGGTLSGTLTVAAVAGVATFSNLGIDKSGTAYTLSASATGFTGATSAAFNITPGPGAALAFTVQPASPTTAGTPITPAVQVSALDAFGNTATAFTGNVSMVLGTNPSGGTLSGTTTVAAAAGVATFSNLRIDKAGSGYSLSATAVGLTGATSTGFDLIFGVASQLAFTVQPAASTTAGAIMTPPIQVTALDAAGNVVTTFAGIVTVAIVSGTGTTGAILSGTLTVGAAGGIATFPTLSIDKSGTAYRLIATSTGLTAGTSANFNITAGLATKLGFTVQPVATTAGRSITPAVRVAAQDAFENTVPTFTGSVTVAIGANPAVGILSGTLTRAAVAGVATFSNLTIDKAGIGYTLTATATGLLGVTSLPFNINPGAATKLAFTVQPASTRALSVITPAVQVTAQDALGNTATGFTSNVTVAIGTNPNFGTLSGTKVISAVAGIATFSTLSIDSLGLGYTLTAAASGLTGATSASFDITSGQALVFTIQPTTTAAGAPITPALQVSARDAANNLMPTFTGNVTVAIAGGTGTAGAILSGTTTVAAVAGVATFPGLSIDKGGTGYQLAATSSGFSTGRSAAFTVTGGTAVKLGFIVQPSNTPAGSIIVPGVQVAVQDALGNTVTGLTGSISVAIMPGTGSGGAILSGTTTAPINAGIASFPTLSINLVGMNYTLNATSLPYTPATSAPFNITAAATTNLVFTVPPSATTAGQVITPAVQVTARNSSGQTVTSFTGPVTVAITAGTGANGAILSGTTTVNAVAGIAIFSNLSINKAGTGFKLSASSPGTAGSNSPSFVINAGAPHHLNFSVQPSNTPVNAVIVPAVEVSVRDSLNNFVKTFVGSITVGLAVNPGGGTLSGTTTVAAAPGTGVAQFTNLSINMTGTGYRLSATTTGLPTATSTAFSITP